MSARSDGFPRKCGFSRAFLTQSEITAIAKNTAVLTDWHPRGTVLHLAAVLVARHRLIPAEQLVDVAMQNRYDFRQAVSTLQLFRGKPMTPVREAIPREGYRRYASMLCWPLVPRGNQWKTEIEPFSILEDENTDYFVDGNFLRVFSQLHPERCFHDFPVSPISLSRLRPSILDSRGGRVKLVGSGLAGVSQVFLSGCANGAMALEVSHRGEESLELMIPAVEPGLYHVTMWGVSWGKALLVREAREDSDDAFEESPVWRRRGFVSLHALFEDEGDVEVVDCGGDDDHDDHDHGDHSEKGERSDKGMVIEKEKGDDKVVDDHGDHGNKVVMDEMIVVDEMIDNKKMVDDKKVVNCDKDEVIKIDKMKSDAMTDDAKKITNDNLITNDNPVTDSEAMNIIAMNDIPNDTTLLSLADFCHTQALIAPLAQPPPQRFLAFRDDQFHHGRFAHPSLAPTWRNMHRAISRQNYLAHLPPTFPWEPASLMPLEEQVMWRNGRRIHTERIRDAMRHLPGYETLFDMEMPSREALLSRVQLLQRLAYMDFYHGAKSRRG